MLISNQQAFYINAGLTYSAYGTFGLILQSSYISMKVFTISRVDVIIFNTNSGEDIDLVVLTSTSLAIIKVNTSTMLSTTISPMIAQVIAMQIYYLFSVSSDWVFDIILYDHLAIDITKAKPANAKPNLAI